MKPSPMPVQKDSLFRKPGVLEYGSVGNNKITITSSLHYSNYRNRSYLGDL